MGRHFDDANWIQPEGSYTMFYVLCVITGQQMLNYGCKAQDAMSTITLIFGIDASQIY